MCFRLVTTMCDTISCFLGIFNDSPLSEHELVVKAYDVYTKKTTRILALQVNNERK